MSKIMDSILGHIVGDAMGVPLEFENRDRLQRHPVKVMIGYGTYPYPAGTWSDDTSMTLALIDSFNNKRKFDYEDIMNNFCNWLHDSKYTPYDKVFDVGVTCMKAIINYHNGIAPVECGLKEEHQNGNGSLMRILPVALYSFYKKLDEEEIVKLTNDISSLTHAHEISKLSCYIYVRYIMFLLDGLDKKEAYKSIKKIKYDKYYTKETIKLFYRILNSDISKLEINDISSSGYVLSTLEAVLWCVLKNNDYESTIIEAINLGEDTDTIASISGSIVGIIYGEDSIPIEWIDMIAKKEYIIELINKFENIITSGE